MRLKLYRIIILQFKADGSETCVSWDFSLRDWTEKGCTAKVSEDGIITCTCNHLTNFAVLMVCSMCIITISIILL